MAFIPIYILILGVTILIDYAAGLLLEKIQGPTRKLFLIVSIIANIGVLAVFKYYDFISENLLLAFKSFGYEYSLPSLSLLLPVGLSFHTFQAMSYTIEVYRGRQKAERNLGTYALYVLFFPQLVAGPIERPQHLIPQLVQNHSFDYRRIVEGLRLILWGFFKKLVIADRLAIYVNWAYNDPLSQSGITLAVATIFFAFQIYCDFSGYSDIAIGTAKVIGINLMINFNRPYFSKNFTEFWRRWHISLSSWFRDYLYIPLGGNRVSMFRLYGNLFIVFLLSGFWHGAHWTFIVWGLINGFYLMFSLMTSKLRQKVVRVVGLEQFPKTHQFLQIIFVFSLVCLAWIFFRARNLTEAITILKKILLFDGPFDYGNFSLMVFSLFGIGLLVLVELKEEYGRKGLLFISNPNGIVRKLSYVILIVIILLIGVFDGGQFIYFQF
jgi:D-alanyl-lipoteichoic acid acyltransferase DltB (MBOAT superfamily)